MKKTFTAILILLTAVFICSPDVMAAGRTKPIGTIPKTIAKPPPITGAVIFNDTFVPREGTGTDVVPCTAWSDGFYVGDFGFDEGLTRDSATVILMLAHANTSTATDEGSVTVVYETSFDNQGWIGPLTTTFYDMVRHYSVTPTRYGLFYDETNSDGFDPGDTWGTDNARGAISAGPQIARHPWEAAGVAFGAGPYSCTLTTMIAFEISKTNYLRFKACNEEITPCTIDLIGMGS